MITAAVIIALLLAAAIFDRIATAVGELEKISARVDERTRIERARYSREQQMLDGVEADHGR